MRPRNQSFSPDGDVLFALMQKVNKKIKQKTLKPVVIHNGSYIHEATSSPKGSRLSRLNFISYMVVLLEICLIVFSASSSNGRYSFFLFLDSIIFSTH